jgi:two-component system, OmpR family, response regulator
MSRTETLDAAVVGRPAALRILVVDDEERIVSLVARALRAEGFAADVAAEADRAVEMAAATSYDLVILDLRMPGRGGMGALQEIIARRPQQRVMVLSALGDVDSKVTALNMGADDYLAKPFSLDELLARVRARLRVGRRVERASTAAEAEREAAGASRISMDPDRQEVDVGFGAVTMSRREFLLLRELVRNAGRTVSKERLLSSVWGFSHDPGSNVVDVYVRRVRARLGDDVIVTVRGEGYRVDADR